VLAALTGPAELIGIDGEPGVGKTRLLRAATTELGRAGWDVAWLVGSHATATVPLAALGPLLAQQVSAGAEPTVDAFAAGAGAILARTRTARLVLVLDDAHLLDPVSAALVEWASNDTEASVAIATRPGERLPQPLARLRQERPDAWLELHRLSRDDVATVLGTALGGPVDGVTVEYVWQITSGNALFVRELVTAGWRSGALRQVHGVWCWHRGAAPPSSLAGLVAQRLAALTPAAHAALEVVACGEPLPPGVLAGLATAEAIAELERDRLLAVDDTGAVRPTHPMIGEAVRAGIGPLRRHQVYGELTAAVLHSDRSATADGGELRAATWAIAGEVDVPVELLLRAGWEALHRYDLGLAELLAKRSARAGAGWPAEQLLAEVCRRQRRPDQVERLLATASDVRNPTAQRVRSAIIAAETLYWVQADLDRAATALSTVDSDPAGLAMRAMLALFDGRSTDALQTACAVLAGPTVAPQVRMWLHTTAAFAALCAGRYRQGSDLAEAGIALAAEGAAPSPWVPHQLEWARCMALCGLGRLEEAAAAAERGYADGVRRHSHELAGSWAAFGGFVARIRGRLARSTELYQEGAALLGEHDPLRLGSVCLLDLAIAHAQEGRLEPAQQALQAALDQLGDGVNRAIGAWIAQARAWIAFGSGQRRLAVRLAFHSATLAEAGGGYGTAMIGLNTAARFGAAGLASDGLGRLAGIVDGPWAGLFHRHAVGLRDGDGRALDAVATGYSEIGAELLAAEAARAAAAAHRRAGHVGSATMSAARADGWLAACGNPSSPTVPAALPSQLTGRERDVVTLAATGWASRRIAEHLGLSVRTVDNHLGRAYRKLGVAGRRSIAPGEPH
jgi:DNA-binding CsgD family transcriptional regulator